jgi:ribonuclease HI
MHIGVPWCSHCVDIVEDTLHVLRDCPLAKSVWCNLLTSNGRSTFFTGTIKDWVLLNLHQNLGKNMDRDWSCVWATCCYFLWTWRNREAHDDSRLRPYRPWSFILEWVDHYRRADVNDITSSITRLGAVDIAWQSPEDGWICLNTDGASKSGEIAGCGGLLRNSHGQWINGFSRNLGRCSAYIAELWGVLEGLRLARASGISKLQVHVDSQVVVHTINNTKDGSFVGWRLIKEIRRMLELDWEVKVCHSYREANACADALANLGCNHGPELRTYEQCPASLSNLFLADIMGISTPRVCVA